MPLKVAGKVAGKVASATVLRPTFTTMAMFASPGRESPPVRPVVPVFNVLAPLADTLRA